MSDRERDPAALYPVGEKQPGKVRTLGGHELAELTLENIRAGRLAPADIAISAEVLRLQAEVARAAGRARLAENLERGAELADVPQQTIFETYELLRPGRAKSKRELLDLAEAYRHEYGAPHVAALIEDAAAVYERRGLFRRRF